jgi:hypothetical protein
MVADPINPIEMEVTRETKHLSTSHLAKPPAKPRRIAKARQGQKEPRYRLPRDPLRNAPK